VSDGLLETIRVRRGRMPFLDRHVARLRGALAETGGGAPARGLETRLLRFAAAGELVVRLVVDAEGEHVTTRSVPGRDLAEAVVSLVPHEPYAHKSTARAVFDRALAGAASRGAAEAILLTPEGCIAEGCVSSVFFWYGEVLCTPALELGILPGVGRGRVVEVARAAGVAVEEGCHRVAQVVGAAGFLVNAVRGVNELLAMDGRPLPRDPRTAALAAAFWP
jgi:branched-subunit amino acid aminotransferase/4-amino-4-deoxychorismate lyase